MAEKRTKKNSRAGQPTRKAVREVATPLIKEEKGLFCLPGVQSLQGHPVCSTSKAFIESIALELNQKGTLDAADFGPYSIYCTYRDLICDRQFFDERVISQLIQTDHVQVDAQCSCIWSTEAHDLRPRYLALCTELGVVNAVDHSDVSYAESLAHHVSNLPDHEKTVIGLLNGMRGIPISVSMLLLRGKLSLEQLQSYIGSATTTGSQITDLDVHRGRTPPSHSDPAIEAIGAFLNQMS
jgi:hypothetical protein